MKRKLKVLILVLTLLFVSLQTSTLAQLREVEIKEITINSIIVPVENHKDIVISSNDAIAFKYELLTNASQNSTQPFFYNAVLIHNDYNAPRVSGLTEIIYSNLNEGDYIFEVNAFDLGGAWVSSVAKIRFRVNNKEAGLLQKINQLEQEKVVADSTIQNLKLLVLESQSVINIELLVIVVGGIAVVFLILFLVFKSKSSKHKKDTKKYKNACEKFQQKVNELESKISQEHNDSEIEVKKLKDNMDFMMKKFDDIFELNKNVSDDVLLITSKTGELDDLQSQKNVMFSNIVKGITDPTQVIKGLIDLLRNYDFNANDTKNIIENIIDTTNKIINISEDLQRFIEFVESSNVTLELDKTNPAEIVKRAVNMNLKEAENKNIQIKYNVSSDVLPIKLDVQKIIVVLYNLIDNAVKFTNDGGKISINCFNKNNAVFFEVNDNGIGISQDDLKKIYKNMEEEIDRNNLLSNTTIGLLTVKKYVEAHNGKVIVSSVVGKGSSFSFNIPYEN